MKKRVVVLAFITIMLFITTIICFADESEITLNEQNEVNREDVEQEYPSISSREATISMLLNSGWTLKEIDEWYTEEDLKELDESAKAISNSTQYIVGYENTETEEVVTKEMTRQEFEYALNKSICDEDEHDITALSAVSSNGVLELQPIYGWTDMDHITHNNGIEFGYEAGGYSGASIWNADNECYLKQNMGLIWMSNNTYAVQYRYEWKKEPHNNLIDYFAVAPATDLTVHENSREKFTFKYNYNGTEFTEEITPASHTCNQNKYWCTLNRVSMGQGKQVKVLWPAVGDTTAKNLRGFLTYYLSINNRYTYDKYYVYAQYYHGKVAFNRNASIGVTSSGIDLSFSISPNINLTAESHPMEVRARNIYMS